MEPKYTIEQIDLLRRLRKSGMTKDEIVRALDTMERLDGEYDNRYGFIRNSNSTNQSKESQNQNQNRNVTYPSNGSYGNNAGNYGNNCMMGVNNTSNVSMPVINFAQPSAVYTSTGTSSTFSFLQANKPAQTQVTTTSSTNNSSSNPTMSWHIPGNYGNTGSMDTGLTPEDEEVEELIRKGPLSVKEEIKSFMADRKISQMFVSQKTGISQSYISLFLVQGIEMKSNTQKTLYSWYVHEKKGLPFTTTIAPKNQPKPTQEEPTDNIAMSTPTTSASDKNDKGNTGKKRFVWKDSCIPILEKYFEQNQYPDDYEREVIADACNSVIQIPGYELPSDKLVTPIKVYNWFCNKRKDQKRRKHIAEMEAAANNELRLTIPNPGFATSSSSSTSSQIKTEVNSPDDCSIISEKRSCSPNQDPMQLAVEMAAVNHSILALVNQHDDEMSDDSGHQ
ncbi:homeobox-containing protein 1-like [Saccoglossus kowalevskii]|uniref:Homeobox-containing protein 1-like n=1 Tax=Saccoglossus kowalevskii TaxID=10224 RepID=A0ABM0LUD2_SACKO|nr:PREDICTED: homeobox-containing protein 1-like [Saccoglossus kowalevskii]